MGLNTDQYPVRVWLGYSLEKFKESVTAREQFYKDLGSIFIPATIQVMRPLGLTAYLPTVVPKDSYSLVPDEVALVFYKNKDIYHEACKDSVGGRSYSLLHQTIFNFEDGKIPKSHSGFPDVFKDKININILYYYLFSHGVDWQDGAATTTILVNTGENKNLFIENLNHFFNSLKKSPPAGMDNLIFSINANCLVFWSHWEDESKIKNLTKSLKDIRVVLNCQARKSEIPIDIFGKYDGLNVSGGDSFNFKFQPKV